MIASSARSVKNEKGTSINRAAQAAASGCPSRLLDRAASLQSCNGLETCPEHCPRLLDRANSINRGRDLNKTSRARRIHTNHYEH